MSAEYGVADFFFDAVRVTWVVVVLCILVMDMEMGRASLIGAHVCGDVSSEGWKGCEGAEGGGAEFYGSKVGGHPCTACANIACERAACPCSILIYIRACGLSCPPLDRRRRRGRVVRLDRSLHALVSRSGDGDSVNSSIHMIIHDGIDHSSYHAVMVFPLPLCPSVPYNDASGAHTRYPLTPHTSTPPL